MAMPQGWTPDGRPMPNIGPEQVIWKNEVMTGIIHRNVAETQVITNLRVMQNERSVSLADLDDIIVMNSHRESQSQGQRYYIRGARMSYGMGSSKGKTIGDVVFMYHGQPVIVFKQIVDPTGVSRLAKTARRSYITAMKAAEKVDAKLKKEKEKEIQNYAKVQLKQNKAATVSVSAESGNTIQCNKCGNSNPANLNFCIQCGSALSSNCSKCGHVNPSGSAFCNNCGFTLA
jgi:Double zinc ribbon